MVDFIVQTLETRWPDAGAAGPQPGDETCDRGDCGREEHGVVGEELAGGPMFVVAEFDHERGGRDDADHGEDGAGDEQVPAKVGIG